VQAYGIIDTNYMVSFDLDGLDTAVAPGVSALSPSSGGLQPQTWFTAARLAGTDVRCTSFDIVELNPTFDRDEQTARVAALTIWNFLSGLLDRQ
jgi:arginase family enzyme